MNAKLDSPILPRLERGRFGVDVLKSEIPVVAAFLASWSRPCQVLDPVLEEVAAACAGKAKVVAVDADDNPELSLWYGVQCIPALLFFVRGELRAQLVGTASRAAILGKLRAVSKASRTGSRGAVTRVEPRKEVA